MSDRTEWLNYIGKHGWIELSPGQGLKCEGRHGGRFGEVPEAEYTKTRGEPYCGECVEEFVALSEDYRSSGDYDADMADYLWKQDEAGRTGPDYWTDEDGEPRCG